MVNDVHYLTGNLRYSVEQTHSEVYGATVTGFPNGNMDHILFGKKYNENMTGSEGTTRALGAVATLGYSYDYRYSADLISVSTVLHSLVKTIVLLLSGLQVYAGI